MRSGPYKLIEHFDDDSVELFKLTDDLSETHNLAGELPELATKLRSRLAAWRQETGAAMPVRKQPPAE